jgi:hypothetical protein
LGGSSIFGHQPSYRPEVAQAPSVRGPGRPEGSFQRPSKPTGAVVQRGGRAGSSAAADGSERGGCGSQLWRSTFYGEPDSSTPSPLSEARHRALRTSSALRVCGRWRSPARGHKEAGAHRSHRPSHPWRSDPSTARPWLGVRARLRGRSLPTLLRRGPRRRAPAEYGGFPQQGLPLPVERGLTDFFPITDPPTVPVLSAASASPGESGTSSQNPTALEPMAKPNASSKPLYESGPTDSLTLAPPNE